MNKILEDLIKDLDSLEDDMMNILVRIMKITGTDGFENSDIKIELKQKKAEVEKE